MGPKLEAMPTGTGAGNRVGPEVLEEGCPATSDRHVQVQPSSLHGTLAADKPRTSLQSSVTAGYKE